MKRCLALLIALPIFITACKKNHGDDPVVWPAGGDPGCIERIYIHKSDHTINPADIATVDNLFARNGVDHSNFRYFYYYRDTFQMGTPPYEKHDRQVVYFDRFAKGLHFFRTEGSMIFWDDTVHQNLIKPVEVPALDTVPTMTLPRLRALFRYHLAIHYGPRNYYGDSCFSAEFGFYKKYDYSASPGPDSTFKAWRVTVKNQPIAPAAFYRDDDESLIYFDKGAPLY